MSTIEYDALDRVFLEKKPSLYFQYIGKEVAQNSREILLTARILHSGTI